MTAEEEEQARRDKRWAKLLAAPPAGVGPIGALAGMVSPSQAHLIEEQRRERETGATLAASGRRLDLDLERGVVTIHPAVASAPRDDEGVTMAGKGETYARADGRFAFRLKAGNGEVVATDGNQGYEARASATSTLTNLMNGKYDVAEVYERADGKWAFRIKASNGQVVATDGGESYASAANAQSTADKINAGTYAGDIVDL